MIYKKWARNQIHIFEMVLSSYCSCIDGILVVFTATTKQWNCEPKTEKLIMINSAIIAAK